MTPAAAGRTHLAVATTRPGRLDRVQVADRRLLRPDGTSVVVVETDDLDLPALDESRRAAAEAAFTRLCRTLQTPLQVLVQVRRWVDGHASAPETVRSGGPSAPAATAPAIDPDVATRLRRASADHRASSLAARAAFRRRVFLLVSCHGDDARTLVTAERSVTDALSAAGIAGHTLDAADLRRLVAEAWDGAAPEASTGEPVRPAWREHPTHLVSGGVLLRGVVLRRFPGVPVSPGWLAPLLLTAADCDIAVHVHPVPVGQAVAGLNRRLRMLRADQLVDLERDGVGDAGVEAGVDGALDLRARLARNESRSVRISVTAVARARAPAGLDTAATALRLAFGAMLADGEITHLRHHDAALTCWPLGEDRLAGAKLADSAAAATCTPWVEALCDDRGGYALGRATATGSPVRLDPFDTARQANANFAVLAASGHGKSYLVGTVLLEAAAQGVGAVVVDPEGEYGHLVRALGGEHVSLAPGSGAAINVFDAGDVNMGDDDRRAEVTGAVVDLASVLCGGLDDVERARVDHAAAAALDAAAHAGRTAVLADCLPSLEAAPRVALVLRRFCTGPLGDLFSRPTTVRLDAPVVGVSLRDLRDELVPAATLVVAEWLWALVRRDRRRRHLVFDEVGLLCAHAPLRRLLTQLARRCRKYHASLVVATQNATDLLATEEGRVIATNPAITLLGGHRGAETALMQSAYALTDAQRRSLEAAARGEFLLLAGARRLGVRIETPPLHHALLTGGMPGG